MNPKHYYKGFWDMLMDEQGIVPKAKEKVKEKVSGLLAVEEPVLVPEAEHVPSGTVLEGEIED